MILEQSATIPVPREEVFWLKRHHNLNKQAETGDFELMFLGDSLTHNWNFPPRGGTVWNKYYAGRKAINFGAGADRLEHILWRVENSHFTRFQPRLVILLAGTNNTARNNPRGDRRRPDRDRLQSAQQVAGEQDPGARDLSPR